MSNLAHLNLRIREMSTKNLVFFSALCLLGRFQCYNLDFNSPLIKSTQSSNKTAFGFSLSVFFSKKNNQKYILAGAPTDQVHNSATKNSGSFYSCPISKDVMDCVQRSLGETSEGSLFGYVLETQYNDSSVYTCAPRFMRVLINVKYVEGACWQLNEDFDEVETISNSDCVKSIKNNARDYKFRNCLTGGALIGLGNKQLLVTAPYSYDGRGLLINSRFQPESNSRDSTYLNIERIMSTYQLAGLSMSVGKIFHENGVKTIVLGAPGMPQSNLTNLKMGYGQVILVKLSNNVLTFKGFIFGDIFGSAFGYSVLVMDLNGDGFDELIVGAPYTGNNRGKVFVYWNQNIDEVNEGGYRFPLTVTKPTMFTSSKKDDNGQFGNCLENIGDINKDSFLDLAVGAPFENDGRGSVYIFLGRKDGQLLLSQKIEGSQIDPDFRGFGFSIYGRGVDLDGNNYPDVLIGSAVSGHVVGLRSRPLITVYAKNMLPSQEYYIPYNLDALAKCSFEGEIVGCLEISVSMYYYYPNLNQCPPNSLSRIVNFTLDLDRTFLNSSHSKRVHFDTRSNTLKGEISIECKPPSMDSPSTGARKFSILFPSITFFNISVPIDVVLKWSMTDSTVPKRNYEASEALANLAEYPMMDRNYVQLSNKVLFGAGCTPQSCRPIFSMQASLSLTKSEDEYILNIGSSSSFTLKVNVQNIASSPEDRAYNTFIKINYNSVGISLKSITPGQYRLTSSGLTYAVVSPLEIQSSEESQFIFSLSNDFIQNAEKYIYLNISLDGMSPQKHLETFIMKIRIRMIANIDLKVSVTQIDTSSYHKVPILGISAITDEKKIGPRLKLKLSLSNIEQKSVVVASKLVIYFPWEVSGDPSESHGQYLLYLQQFPTFFISGGIRNITCDGNTLKQLVNPINTKMFESKRENQIKDVSLANVALPKKVPKMASLEKNILLLSDGDKSISKSTWQNNVLLNCMNGTARCLPIVCDLGPLSRHSGEINIELDFRIWIHTFVENFIKYKFVQTEIPIFWVPEVDYDIVLLNPEGSYKLIGIKTDNLQKPTAPPSLDVLWAILIAVCVGVILLASIILILYRCKFFQRQNLAAGRTRRRLSKQT